MGNVRVTFEECGHDDPAQTNHEKAEECEEGRGGVMGEGQELSEEDESRINEVTQVTNGGLGLCNGSVQGQEATQQRNQHSQGPIIRWERFLPFRSLKVLLVENDDSTRQVVSALLRNCSYEVTAAENGLQAWRILVDLRNHIDLVLTEVVMPCLSGIGLLCKIMNHKTCKTIPVIMMSSHDSMGLVFKCLSKGAVDFLVKPIRKNELKNLWQHVWRRCHSSSGSGSESGVRTQKSADSKSAEDSDNNDNSNSNEDNGSTGLNIGDGSDNGSGTQNSWTKRAAEVDSPPLVSPWDKVADPHDSTCAQVIIPKQEVFLMPESATDDLKRQNKLSIDDPEGKELDFAALDRPSHSNCHTAEKFCMGHPPVLHDGPSRDIQEFEDKHVPKAVIETQSDNVSTRPNTQAANLDVAVAGGVNTEMETVTDDVPITEKTFSDSKDPPFLGLSLKRLRSTVDGRVEANDERNVLRHSGFSAFSRYNTASTQAPTGYMDSCSVPLDQSSEAEKKNILVPNNPLNANQVSNTSSNEQDMGSSTKNVFSKPLSMKDKSVPMSTTRGHHVSAFQPVQYCPSPQVLLHEKAIDAAMHHPKEGSQIQVYQYHHHHHHHHQHAVMPQHQQNDHPDQEELSKMTVAVAPPCGSSNVLATNGHCMNSSMNGSRSGSNHGSNALTNTGVTNGESDTGAAGKGSNGGGSGSGSGVDQARSAQREAALTKFRQKRKERCFEKKVRYQSRKRLAEQRPRVRGQFVRQMAYDNSTPQEDD
ncbi:Two-component response regulator-like [Nymphaea thermarum]|nr:Two-component response regulator-like [Nymphaea thermarum]